MIKHSLGFYIACSIVVILIVMVLGGGTSVLWKWSYQRS